MPNRKKSYISRKLPLVTRRTVFSLSKRDASTLASLGLPSPRLSRAGSSAPSGIERCYARRRVQHNVFWPMILRGPPRAPGSSKGSRRPISSGARQTLGGGLMADAADFRRIALSFDGAAEYPHFDRRAFKARVTFATLAPDELTANIKFSPDEQALKCTVASDAFIALDNAWGRQGWTRGTLAARLSASRRGAGQRLTGLPQLFRSFIVSRRGGGLSNFALDEILAS